MAHKYKLGDIIRGNEYLGDVPKVLWKTEKRMVYLRCQCGKEYSARLGDVNSGNTKSCGCTKGKWKIKEHA